MLRVQFNTIFFKQSVQGVLVPHFSEGFGKKHSLPLVISLISQESKTTMIFKNSDPVHNILRKT